MSTTTIDRYRALAAELEALAANPEGLLAVLAKQLLTLRFAGIDLETTWRIGSLLRQAGVDAGLPIAIDVAVGLQTAFHAALPGSSADNDAWARRKAAVADRYIDSSLAVGLKFDRDQGGFDAACRLPLGEYAAHGGAFPLLLATGIPVGHVVVSGLPSIHDHALVVTAIEEVRNGQ
jgi:uncharacterized protein (UPF0303 family)